MTNSKTQRADRKALKRPRGSQGNRCSILQRHALTPMLCPAKFPLLSPNSLWGRPANILQC